MPRHRSTTLKVAPMQHVVAVEITDPAEQAALDKVRIREKRKQQKRTVKPGAEAARLTNVKTKSSERRGRSS